MKCKKASSAQEENLTREEVLEKYTGGPLTGVFTDGAGGDDRRSILARCRAMHMDMGLHQRTMPPGADLPQSHRPTADPTD